MLTQKNTELRIHYGKAGFFASLREKVHRSLRMTDDEEVVVMLSVAKHPEHSYKTSCALDSLTVWHQSGRFGRYFGKNDDSIRMTNDSRHDLKTVL